MAKPLKTILKKETEEPSIAAGYMPKGGDERKFVAKHLVAKREDDNGNKDDVFNASNIKPIDRYKEAHGYNPGQDAKVYEEVEQIDEYTHEGAVRAASIAKAQGKIKKAQLLMRLAKALESNDETTARGLERELESIKEESELEEMSKMQMKKREKLVKGMKKNIAGFRQRYGKDAENVMYATATKQAMGEEIDVTLLSLYANLDDDNRAAMMVMIDEGRQEELYSFASTLMESEDADAN